MGEIDRKILKPLQDNTRASLETIAENTFLSSPAVLARVERLEEEGVITGYHAFVDPVRLGHHILAYINPEVIPEDKGQFYAYTRGASRILECSCVTGGFSVLLKVAFKSTMEPDMLIGQLQGFGRTSTQTVFFTHAGPGGADVDEIQFQVQSTFALPSHIV